MANFVFSHEFPRRLSDCQTRNFSIKTPSNSIGKLRKWIHLYVTPGPNFITPMLKAFQAELRMFILYVTQWMFHPIVKV